MPGWNEATWFSFLAGVALKSVAVLGAAWLVTFLLRGRSAAARHLVWMAAFGGLLALPLLTVAVPALPIPGTGAILAPEIVYHANAGEPAPDLAAAPLRTSAARAGNAPRTQPTDWRAALMLAWAVGAGALFLQMLAGLAYMQRLRLRARTMPDDLSALAGELGIEHPVDALETAPGRMPMSFGMLRPAVFMPADSAEWSEDRRRVVLLHELAHVRRGDHAKHLCARVALCAYWWNPLAWLAWRAFLKERERATDDLVLAAGARASDYAAHLLEIARSMRSAPALSAAAVAVARRSQLEGRLLAILDSARNRKSPGRAGALAAAVICAAVVIPLAALQAQDNSQPLPADINGAIRAAVAQRNHEALENLAKTAEEQLQYDVAQRVLESALAIQEQNSGSKSVEYGKELVRLGDVQHKRGDAQANATYRQAIALLGSDSAVAPALIALGVSAVGAKSYDEAFDYFQRAQTASPTKAGEAAMWQAVTRQRQGRDQDADALYQLAINLSAPNTAEQATTLELYAKALTQQSRQDEATEMRGRAAAIRKAIPPVTAPFTRPKGQGQAGPDGLSTFVSSAMGIPASPLPPPSSQSGTLEGLGLRGFSSAAGAAPPRVIRKVEPAYSDEALAARFQGTVVLHVEIGPDGKAHNVSVQRHLGLGLDEKAVEAVSQWLFQPATKDGQPVSADATLEISFRLPQQTAQTAPGEAAVSTSMAVANNGATAPRLVYKVEPEYSQEARAAKYQGTVVLSVEVGVDGTAQNIRVQRSLGLGLDQKAIEAVSKWRFQPGTKDGQPVPTSSTIEVNFRLLEDSAATQSSPAGQATPSGGVFRVGGGVTAPTVLQKAEPEYSQEARAAGYEGTVVLYVEIGPDGQAQKIQVQRGVGLGLDDKAVEAVSKWRFSPGTRFGVPVTVAATIEVNFRAL